LANAIQTLAWERRRKRCDPGRGGFRRGGPLQTAAGPSRPAAGGSYLDPLPARRCPATRELVIGRGQLLDGQHQRVSADAPLRGALRCCSARRPSLHAELALGSGPSTALEAAGQVPPAADCPRPSGLLALPAPFAMSGSMNSGSDWRSPIRRLPLRRRATNYARAKESCSGGVSAPFAVQQLGDICLCRIAERGRQPRAGHSFGSVGVGQGGRRRLLPPISGNR